MMSTEHDFPALIEIESGRLGTRTALTKDFVVPAYVTRDGESLVWVWDDPNDASRGPTAADSTGLLDEFQAINDLDDVVEFVRRFGSIEICDHGLPRTHVVDQYDIWLGQGGCSAVNQEAGMRREPIDRWLHYVRAARAMLEVAEALEYDPPQDASASALEYIRSGVLTDPHFQKEEENELGIWGARFTLGSLVNDWLILGDVRPALNQWLAEGPPELKLRARVFGLIGVQLLQAITRSRDLHLCSGCGTFYLRRGRRRAKRRQRNYCHDCNERGVPARDRQRDRRARQRAATEEIDGTP